MWKQVLIYGLLLAAGTLGLQWLDYQRLARVYSTEVYTSILAAAFLALGILIGIRVFRAPAPLPFDGNPKAVDSLGLSERELEILAKIAEGLSNKEIAQRLNVSPNTVKTHVANVFEKLGAKRRTDAINRARELGILP